MWSSAFATEMKMRSTKLLKMKIFKGSILNVLSISVNILIYNQQQHSKDSCFEHSIRSIKVKTSFLIPQKRRKQVFHSWMQGENPVGSAYIPWVRPSQWSENRADAGCFTLLLLEYQEQLLLLECIDCSPPSQSSPSGWNKVKQCGESLLFTPISQSAAA